MFVLVCASLSGSVAVLPILLQSFAERELGVCSIQR